MSTPSNKRSDFRVVRKSVLDAEGIYQRIQRAIMERRLLPGTKLAEERLAEATGASRGRIRQVLARLAHEQIVTLIPNRGAFISKPTIDEARELFLARRLIEPGLVAELAQRITAEQIAILRGYVENEKAARREDDQRNIIRLSGEFHVALVEMGANAVLLRIMRELTALTCLIITLYDKPHTPACPYTEHAELVDLLQAHDAEGARQHMLQHLLHIEQALDLSDEDMNEPDFQLIFA